MVLPLVLAPPAPRPTAPVQGVLRLPQGGRLVIILAAYPIHEPPVDRIEAAEDRAEQVAFDAARERS